VCAGGGAHPRQLHLAARAVEPVVDRCGPDQHLADRQRLVPARRRAQPLGGGTTGHLVLRVELEHLEPDAEGAVPLVEPLVVDPRRLEQEIDLVSPVGRAVGRLDQARGGVGPLAALLMQALLCVGPYGGVYRPRDAARRMPHAARPLHRITVFHAEVQYPKPATRYEILPDDLLQYLQRVFEKDERGPFPAALLEQLRFAACPRCAVEHARVACPFCTPSAAARPRAVMTVRGEVLCTQLFSTAGVILHASVEKGALRILHHDGGAYRREDGAVVLRGDLDPSWRFGIQGAATLLGRGGELVVLSPARAPERLSVDSDGTGPAFASNGRHRFWTAAGRLLRDASSPLGGASSEGIGDVLSGQTRIWAGPSFGLGLYRASNLSVAFTFDAERRGINDGLRLPPLPGQLVDAACALDERRAWLLLALQHGGRKKHLCLVYSRAGALEASAEATAGDGSWLGTLRGKCATQGMLLAATDSGVARIDVRDGTLETTREFPDAEPFVDAACQLLAGKDGLYVVGPNQITTLKMNQSRATGG